MIGSTSLPQNCACVPRSDGPCHSLHLPGCSAHHPGLPAVHLLWLLQAPQPMELQGTRRSATPQARQHSSLLPPSLCEWSTSRAQLFFGSGVCCGFPPFSPSLPLPSLSPSLPCPCVSVRLHWEPGAGCSFYSAGSLVCLFGGPEFRETGSVRHCVPAVVHRQKNQLVTKEAKLRPMCPRHSQ